MLSLLLQVAISGYLLTVHAAMAITTDTVVGVAGRKVTLPCRVEAVNKRGVEVCWGKGQPSRFTCHNAVINVAGDHVSYRKSHRFSVSSSSSLNIYNSRTLDAGFYHCRVLLPGLFNDQTSTVHLIIIGRSEVSDSSTRDLNAPHSTASDYTTLNALHTTTIYSTDRVTTETGSDVNSTGPMLALVQSPVQQQQLNTLPIFIGDTLRLSFIISIPAVLLAVAHRVWRSRLETPEETSSV